MEQYPIDSQKAFYDNRWEKFQHANSLKLSRCIAILEQLRQTKLVHPKIIDLGCGTGWLTGILGGFGPTLGVDLSEVAVLQAKQRYPFVEFIQANILDWDYPTSCCDIIVSQEVIEHFDDQSAYLETAYGLLKTGGYLILTTPNQYICNAMSEKQRITWSNQPIENWLSLSELRALVPSGFQIRKLRTIIPGYDPKGLVRYFNSYRLRRLLQFAGLLRVHEELCKSLGWGLHILLVAQKQNGNDKRPVSR